MVLEKIWQRYRDSNPDFSLERAGLNLTAEDIARKSPGREKGTVHTFHPIERVRALALVWLFAGLRRDEIRRLRVGCVRWQQGDGSPVCFLDVPVNKPGAAFAKPVDRVVGEAINVWEKVRPPQSKLCDTKTGEMVDFLFLNRMRPIGETCLNHYLIPKLCRKAGVSERYSRANYKSPSAFHDRHATVQC
jgi:integrase